MLSLLSPRLVALAGPLLILACLMAARGLLSCGDADVSFNEDFRDGQGGSIRISTGDASGESIRDPTMQGQRAQAQDQVMR